MRTAFPDTIVTGKTSYLMNVMFFKSPSDGPLLSLREHVLPFALYDGRSPARTREMQKRPLCLGDYGRGIYYPVKALQTGQATRLAQRTTAQVVCGGATEEAT